jgi:AcrR family transcriptional regulator
MKKNSYHHGNLKEDSLKIAFEYIEKNDIDTLTLKTLSEVTGTSRSAIYSHFSSKKALIEMMILNGFIKFDDYLSPYLLDQQKPLLDRLEEGSRAYVQFARDHKVLYRLLFGNKYAHIRMKVMSRNDPSRSGFGALVLVMEAGQESGLFKKENSYKQAIIIWSALHGLTSLLIDGFVGIEEMQDALLESMIQGMISGVLLKR